MIGHTTDDISDVQSITRLAESLATLFPKAEAVAVWDEPGVMKTKRLALRDFSECELARVYSLGSFNLRDEASQQYEAGLIWNRVRKTERIRFLEKEGFQQNRVWLRIRRDALNDCAFRESYVQFCRDQANLFNVTYLYSFDSVKADAWFSSLRGLGAGLRDVYWINVFGSPYINMMGRDRLLDCPAFEVAALPNGHVVIRATEIFCDPDSPPLRDVRVQIRDHLGQRFFVKRPTKPQWRIGGTNRLPFTAFLQSWVSWWCNIDAEVRPKFDWSAILLEEIDGKS